MKICVTLFNNTSRNILIFVVFVLLNVLFFSTLSSENININLSLNKAYYMQKKIFEKEKLF